MAKWAIRESFDVDILTAKLPDEVTAAIGVVASETGLGPDWMNNAVGTFPGSQEYISKIGRFATRSILRGRVVDFVMPADDMLLAMKLDTDRDKDHLDTIRLAFSSGRTTFWSIMEMYQDEAAMVITADKANYIQDLSDDIALLLRNGVTAAGIQRVSDTALRDLLE